MEERGGEEGEEKKEREGEEGWRGKVKKGEELVRSGKETEKGDWSKK